MSEQRWLGIDLHRRRFTCCVRLGSGRNYLSEWNLEQLPQFVKKLRPTDEVAVEVTGNTRLFYEAVVPHVAGVVVVDPNQFRVISHSVKKTDPNDARNLALYLAKGLLPEVRMKQKAQAEVASITQTQRAGIPVEAHTVDPIFVFDHLVIPAGTQVLGRVSQVESASRKQRGLAIANGNFSPLRKAQVDFDTLTLADGTRFTLHTAVTQGAPSMVHLVAGDEGKKKRRVSQAVEEARQQAKAREQQTLNEISAPGKMQRIKAWLWAQFPYHQPKIVKGTFGG